jgi:hypothetical protein
MPAVAETVQDTNWARSTYLAGLAEVNDFVACMACLCPGRGDDDV